MPPVEYRIIVHGKIAYRSYTKSEHEIAKSYYQSIGVRFETEVIDLCAKQTER
jgi:hypothetical protein